MSPTRSPSLPFTNRASVRKRQKEGPSRLVRQRLRVFRAAFLADPRPGLAFEDDRLVLLNDAAQTLLRPAAASDAFLNALKRAVDVGRIERGLVLRARYGIFMPVLRPARSRAGDTTRLCFLIKQPETTSIFETLSGRERDVVMLLVTGETNQEIATGLGISIETVRKHVSSALKKTGTTTRAGLVGRALER